MNAIGNLIVILAIVVLVALGVKWVQDHNDINPSQRPQPISAQDFS